MCDIVEGGTLSNKPFAEFAEKIVPYLHIETRIPGHPDDGLFREFGFRQHPAFGVIDPKGGLWMRRTGVLSMQNVEKLLADATERYAAFLALKAKANAGDAKAKVKVDVWELELKYVTYEDFRKRYPDLSKLEEDQRDSVLAILGDLTLKAATETLLAAQKTSDPDKLNAAFLVVGEELLAAAKLGAEPFDDNPRVLFYFYLGRAGLAHSRADMLEPAIAGLKEDAEENPHLTKHLKVWNMAVAKLKQDAAEPASEESK